MPSKSEFPARQVREAIRTQIIPWVQNGAPLVMLQPPPSVISYGKPEIKIREIDAPALPALRGVGRDVRIQHWREANLNAFNIPYWGCVMDGEADLVVGVTREMCRARHLKPARWIVSLPAGTLFWLLPGVPITNSGLYWERPHPEKARSRIFWMHITPVGANCHFCSVADGKHWVHPYTFSSSRYLLTQAWRIMQELEEPRQDSQLIIAYSLQLLLLDTIRGLQNQEKIPFSMDFRAQADVCGMEMTIQRALQYMDDHLNDSDLKATDIARHAQTSVTHLGRLFRRHLDTSIHQTLINKRFEFARQLLKQSTYDVHRISYYCGYTHPPTFIAAFRKRYGMTPMAYRQSHQKTE